MTKSIAVKVLLAILATAPASMAHPVVKVPVDAASVVSHVHAQTSSATMTSAESRAELEEMLQEMAHVHEELQTAQEHKNGGAAWAKQISEMETQLEELTEMLEALEAEEASKDHVSVSHEELKSEIERLRKAVTLVEHQQNADGSSTVRVSHSNGGGSSALDDGHGGDGSGDGSGDGQDGKDGKDGKDGSGKDGSGKDGEGGEGSEGGSGSGKDGKDGKDGSGSGKDEIGRAHV